MADYEPRELVGEKRPYYVEKLQGDGLWKTCFFEFATWDAANYVITRLCKRQGTPRHEYRIRKRHG